MMLEDFGISSGDGSNLEALLNKTLTYETMPDAVKGLIDRIIVRSGITFGDDSLLKEAQRDTIELLREELDPRYVRFERVIVIDEPDDDVDR